MLSQGPNYVAGAFAFGDLAPAASLRSLELFAREVAPAVQRQLR